MSVTSTRTLPNRVAEPSASFWVIKILTTGMGEALSDRLVTRFAPAPTVLITAVVFVVVLAVQFRSRRFSPWKYWSAVAMVAVFGTMVADVAHVVAGIPYLVSTLVFLAVLVIVFAAWRRTEGTLDVHTITTTRRQGFYWATVIVTFAMGTAAGDLIASTLHLGYLLGAGVFLGGMAMVVALRWTRTLGPVAAFWTAYVLTRPLGASVADWLAVPPLRGGLGYGAGMVSVIALLAILVVIAITSDRRRSGPRTASDG